ncbi:MAG: hypothetical protein DRH90_25860, partial [Deltaproteobacteria bacterium]
MDKVVTPLYPCEMEDGGNSAVAPQRIMETEWSHGGTELTEKEMEVNIFALGLPPRGKPSTSSTAADRSGASRQSNPSGF